MTRVRKTGLGILAFLLALTLGIGLASCGSKDTEPTYGYGEEGTYYCSASESVDYLLTLSGGYFILDMGTSGYSGTYVYSEGTLTLIEGEDEEVGTGCLTESGISLTYGGKTYLFLAYEYYTVTFLDGGSTLSMQSVLNGKAAQDPGESTKEGYVFLGWYADSSFTTRYEFNTAITINTMVYARFVESSGATEYRITYDYTGETTETINGVVYNLPEPEMEGYAFLGWWVSATNNADELTYKYDGETLYEDTTLFAYFVEDGAAYVGASVYDDGITWENYSAAVTEIILRNEGGTEIERFTIQSTDQGYSYDFASLPAGKYTLTIRGGGIDETLTYVSNGLLRASNFDVVSGSVLMYGAVENAERYYISVECGNPSHVHTMVDNGTSLYYDFSGCDMPADGITFTVYAYADGFYYSASSYNYFLGLDSAVVRVDGNTAYWDLVPYAMQYEVYIDGILVTTTSDTSYSLANYGTGTYEISVRPITTGYYSEASEAIPFTKTTLAAPQITGIDDYTISWTEVEGATGYIVKIGDIETTVETGTSLILSDENYTEGLDSYEISVKAMAQDSANDSPYSEAITVTGSSVGSAVSYSNGTVTWQYSLSASEYRITVNDGDETIVSGTNSSPVTLTKSGNNEITICFIDEDDEIYGTASITVYAYAIVFDARGGTAYLDGEVVDTIYVAKGDTVTLPEADYGAATADFLGWYTLPDTTDDPDATVYHGDGYLFEDGTVFTGNSTIVLYAAWVNPRMIVALDPGMGTLYDDAGNLIAEVAISLNGRNYTIVVPETTDAAYVFYGWYSGENGTGTRYTDEKGNAYAPFSDETVTTLYAYWIQVLSITSGKYNASSSESDNVFSVAKGPDINMVSEVTIPESYTVNGVEYAQGIINGTAFYGCRNLKTINIPDTVIYIDTVNNGYDSGTGVFASTPLENVNVYATGEPSTTKEVTYYSEDGVLFWVNPNNDDVELLYYPYGRTDETYEIPETVYNENEYELSGRTEVPVVRYVNALGSRVFSGNDRLVSVEIPEFITTMGSDLFYGSGSLESVTVLAEIETLPDYTFYGCTSLKTVELPDTLREIGSHVFRLCEGLETFDMPDGVTSMGTYVFYGCSSLRNVGISTSLKALGGYAFYQCYSLRAIEIPAGVTEIGDRAFYQCTSLVSVTMQDTVTSLGSYCFYGCESLEGIDLPKGITTLNSDSFEGCSSLRSIVIPEGVTTIGSYAFRYCYDLSYVSLPSTLTTINSQAFCQCTSLTSIIIPASVTSIGSSAFEKCYRLVEVYNLSTLTVTAGNTGNGYVGAYAKSVLTSLDEPSRITTTEDGYSFVADSDGGYSLFDYGGTDTDLVLPDDVDGQTYEINQYAFYGDERITSAVIPDSVPAIGQYAFYGCTALRSVNIPESLTSIATYCFYGCESLVSVVFPDSVTTINTYAFYGCTNLVRVTLGTGMKTINNYAFQNCFKLAEICNLSTTMTINKNNTGNGYVGYYAKSVVSSDEDTAMVYSDGLLFVSDSDGNWYLMGYYGASGDAVLPASVNGSSYEIYDYAFYRNTSLKTARMTGGVTAIGDYAFYGCASLTDVTFASGLVSVGTYCFYGCTALSCAALPDGVSSIGTYCFHGCTALSGASVPGSAGEVPSYCFYGCTGLSSVTLGEGLGSIAAYAFYGCSSLAAVSVPAGVSSIDSYAFSGCSSLAALELGSGLRTIGDHAFLDCTALLYVDIPAGCEEIGDYAFQGCSSLAAITLPNGMTALGMDIFDGSAYYGDSSNYVDGVIYIGAYLMNADISVSGTVTVKEGTLIIAGGAFYGCASMTRLVLPESLTSIGDYAFYECGSLESVTFPAGLESIGDYAFRYCTSLSDVDILSRELTIGQYAFANCSSLTRMDFSTAGYVDIGKYCFYVSYVSEVNLEGVRSIGQYAFYNCTYLTKVEIPGCVQTMDGYAFSGCTGIKEVAVLEGATTMGSHAFYNCTGITKATLEGTLENVGEYCFYGCTKLSDLTICEGVTKLGDYMFRGCTALTTVVIPSTVTSCGSYLFYGCSALSGVTLTEGMTHISNRMFYNCSKLTSITIPSTIETVDQYAFYQNTALTEVIFADGLKVLGSYMFYGCTGIKSVTVPGSVESIGNYCFYNCTGIETVIIEEGVTEIGQRMFYGSSGLKSVVVPASVTAVSTGAFQSCSKLETVYYGGASEDEWNSISITSTSNSTFTGATRYYYSETRPASSGNWWHWVDGVPTVW